MPKPIAIIRYNAGNIQSVLFALERLGVAAIVTDDHETIRNAGHVIFPGVGAANSAMPYLKEHGLDELIRSLEQPFLGICLGMQLMCRHSEEGDTACLGIFDIAVKKFHSPTAHFKIPHMGWNRIEQLQSPLFSGVAEGSAVYFVHSFYAENAKAAIATCNYGKPFSAALKFGNFIGVQFHPEKSADVGEIILKNFLAL